MKILNVPKRFPTNYHSDQAAHGYFDHFYNFNGQTLFVNLQNNHLDGFGWRSCTVSFNVLLNKWLQNCSTCIWTVYSIIYNKLNWQQSLLMAKVNASFQLSKCCITCTPGVYWAECSTLVIIWLRLVQTIRWESAKCSLFLVIAYTGIMQ